MITCKAAVMMTQGADLEIKEIQVVPVRKKNVTFINVDSHEQLYSPNSERSESRFWQVVCVIRIGVNPESIREAFP